MKMTPYELLEPIKPETICCFNCVHCSSNREKWFYDKIQKIAKLIDRRMKLEEEIVMYKKLSWWQRRFVSDPDEVKYLFGEFWSSNLDKIGRALGNHYASYTCCLNPIPQNVDINYDCACFKSYPTQALYQYEDNHKVIKHFKNLAEYFEYRINEELNAK